MVIMGRPDRAPTRAPRRAFALGTTLLCAAALATSFWATGAVEDGDGWVVEVPGGTLGVRALPGQRVELSGPAVLVAEGVVHL